MPGYCDLTDRHGKPIGYCYPDGHGLLIVIWPSAGGDGREHAIETQDLADVLALHSAQARPMAR